VRYRGEKRIDGEGEERDGNSAFREVGGILGDKA
jgi:hypothetical protein